MTYIFPCPQGHLLEANEADAGRPCECPTCGQSFVIPVRPGPGASPAQEAPPVIVPPANGLSAARATPSSDECPLPAAFELGVGSPLDGRSRSGASSAPSPDSGADALGGPLRQGPESERSPLHIPCPNGHELETPVEMLETRAMCPHCGVEFRLRERDSVEHRRKAERERAARERKTGEAWLKWSVVTAVAVVIGLLLMLLSSR